jgi:hypothetical protein
MKVRVLRLLPKGSRIPMCLFREPEKSGHPLCALCAATLRRQFQESVAQGVYDDRGHALRKKT